MSDRIVKFSISRFVMLCLSDEQLSRMVIDEARRLEIPLQTYTPDGGVTEFIVGVEAGELVGATDPLTGERTLTWYEKQRV